MPLEKWDLRISTGTEIFYKSSFRKGSNSILVNRSGCFNSRNGRDCAWVKHRWKKTTLSAQDVLALLAYSDPTQSPFVDLFDQRRRVECSKELNSAIMSYEGRNACSAVQRMYSHLTVLQNELLASGSVATKLIPLKDVVNHGLHMCDSSQASDLSPGAAAMHET